MTKFKELAAEAARKSTELRIAKIQIGMLERDSVIKTEVQVDDFNRATITVHHNDYQSSTTQGFTREQVQFLIEELESVVDELFSVEDLR